MTPLSETLSSDGSPEDRARALLVQRLEADVITPLRRRGFRRHALLGLARTTSEGMMHWLRMRGDRNGNIVLAGGIWPAFMAPADRIGGPTLNVDSSEIGIINLAQATPDDIAQYARTMGRVIDERLIAWFDRLGSVAAMAHAFTDRTASLRSFYMPPWDDFEAGFIFMALGRLDFAQSYFEVARDAFRQSGKGWATLPATICDDALRHLAQGPEAVEQFLKMNRKDIVATWTLTPFA